MISVKLVKYNTIATRFSTKVAGESPRNVCKLIHTILTSTKSIKKDLNTLLTLTSNEVKFVVGFVHQLHVNEKIINKNRLAYLRHLSTTSYNYCDTLSIQVILILTKIVAFLHMQHVNTVAKNNWYCYIYNIQ
jgi:hypothetical protein